MVLEYISTFSINSYKHDLEHPAGMYYDTTGYGAIFLDQMWALLSRVWKMGAQYSIEQSKWKDKKRIKKSAVRDDKLEMSLIQYIITVDFHEFIHHFLNVNQIENDCCNHDKNPSCWLCNFTNMLDVDLSNPVLGGFPQLLANFH